MRMYGHKGHPVNPMVPAPLTKSSMQKAHNAAGSSLHCVPVIMELSLVENPLHFIVFLYQPHSATCINPLNPAGIIPSQKLNFTVEAKNIFDIGFTVSIFFAQPSHHCTVKLLDPVRNSLRRDSTISCDLSLAPLIAFQFRKEIFL